MAIKLPETVLTENEVAQLKSRLKKERFFRAEVVSKLIATIEKLQQDNLDLDVKITTLKARLGIR